MVRPPAALRLGLRLVLPFLEWHSSSLLGCGTGFRAEDRLSQRLGCRHCGSDADARLFYRRLRCYGGVRVNDQRTALARVRGLGSARAGVAHWWLQRVTALLL